MRPLWVQALLTPITEGYATNYIDNGSTTTALLPLPQPAPTAMNDSMRPAGPNWQQIRTDRG